LSPPESGPQITQIKTLFPSFVTTTEKVGLAMIQVAENGFSKPVLETRDINALASDSH